MQPRDEQSNTHFNFYEMLKLLKSLPLEEREDLAAKIWPEGLLYIVRDPDAEGVMLKKNKGIKHATTPEEIAEEIAFGLSIPVTRVIFERLQSKEIEIDRQRKKVLYTKLLNFIQDEVLKVITEAKEEQQ